MIGWGYLEEMEDEELEGPRTSQAVQMKGMDRGWIVEERERAKETLKEWPR
jgi:hypothetical protein